MRNFNNPYFSRDIAEFWRRWHISLTTWFRDYVYIPLGGSRVSKWKIVRNTFVIFLLSGFWHGANWTFIAWGTYHALLFLPLILLGQNRKYTNQVAEGHLLPTWKEALQILITFGFVVLGWIIFRAETITQAWNILCSICSRSLLSIPWLMTRLYYIPTVLWILLMLFVEWFNRGNEHGLNVLSSKHNVMIKICILLLTICVEYYFLKTIDNSSNFIYFQF